MLRLSSRIRCDGAHAARIGLRGITLVEVTVSTVLVGLIVVGALRCLAGSIQTGQTSVDATLAMLLAEDLMEEILQQDYAEPVDTAAFGIEGAEIATLRTDWDDVDDYDDWLASPPQDIEGNPLATSDWERSVVIQQVARNDLLDVRADTDDTGVKKITVVVSQNGVVRSELVSVQTTAWISMIPDYGQATTTGQLPPVNEAPTAAIGPHAVSGTGSVSVMFNGSNSSDPENEPLEFEWDFGDSTGSSLAEPSHTFLNPGAEPIVFSITLVVKDIHGGSDKATSIVTVYPN